MILACSLWKKRPESLLGKWQREGSQAIRSVPEQSFPAWNLPTPADGWGWWETSAEPWESPSSLQGSPEETSPKRHRTSARAPAVGWALPPACLLLVPWKSAWGPMGLQGACTPALGRHCQRDVDGLPGQRLAGPCLPPARQRGAGWPRAGGLRGLARFRFPVQEILCQRDRGSLPGIWGAAICNPLGARRDAGQPGAVGIRRTPWDLGPSPWETPQKRLRRFARGLAGWSLPPTGASGGCRVVSSLKCPGNLTWRFNRTCLTTRRRGLTCWGHEHRISDNTHSVLILMRVFFFFFFSLKFFFLIFSAAFPRNSRGRLGFPGPTQEEG